VGKKVKMKPKWLVQNYEQDGSLQPLIDEIKNQKMTVEVVKYIPFESGEYNMFNDNDCVIFYGTLNLARQLQREKGWIPGVYCNFDAFHCHKYYSYWGKYLLNKDYIMLPMLEILRKRDEIFKQFSKNGQIFIRPDSGAKSFTGQLVEYDKLDREFEHFKTNAGRDLDQIITIISSPKKIEIEWRCTVVNKNVVAFSRYRKDGKLNVEKKIDMGALLFADDIARKEWQPDKAYCLDICKVEYKYYLLEINSFSCSGLYLSDPKPIVKEVSKIALEEWKEYNEQ